MKRIAMHTRYRATIYNPFGGIRNAVIWLVCIIIIPTLFFGMLQLKYHGVYSQIDEGTHIGYAWSVSHGHIPAKGDTVEQPILDDWACSGQSNVELPSCGNTGDVTKFPAHGQQYNYIHPPLYYAITGFCARVITHFARSMSFAQAARLMQVPWIILGLALTYRALRTWGLKRLYAYSAVTVIPFVPVFLNAGSAVTNDAPALACGAMLLWCAARVFKQHRCDWLPATMALLFCLMKGTFAFGFLGFTAVMFVASVLWWYLGDTRLGFNGIISSCVTGVVSLLCIFGWSKFQSARGASHWQNPNLVYRPKMEGSPIWEWARTALSGLNLGAFTSAGRDMSDQPAFIMWASLLAMVMIGAAGFLYFQHDGDSSHTLLLGTTVFSILLYPTLVQIREYLESGLMFSVVTVRYGMCLVPLSLCCWALSLQNRRSCIVAVAFPAFGICCGFISVLTATTLT